MDLNKFIENFKDIFDEPSEITCDSSTAFKDMDDWNSIMALSLIAMVNDEYNVSLKGDDIKNSQTVADLFEVIKSRC